MNTASEHGASITMEFVVEVLSVDGTTHRAVVPDGRYSDWWEHERITSSAFDAARDRLERS